MSAGSNEGAREGGPTAMRRKPVLRWPDPPRGQLIRDALLAYLARPRVVRDIARHIQRPVPTTTGHLAAMQRRGLVKRFGYGVYGLPGYEGPLPTYRRPRPALPISIRLKVRAAMREPITFAALVGTTEEPADLVRRAVHALWMAGVIAGDEQSGYRPMRSLISS